MVPHSRFGLVLDDPRDSISKVWFAFIDPTGTSSQVWFGRGGSTLSIIQGLVWFQRIYVVHHPRFGLVAEDPRGPLSKVWFGFRGSMFYIIPGLVW